MPHFVHLNLLKPISVATKRCTVPPFEVTNTPLSLSLFQTELELVQSRGVPSEEIIFSGVSKQLSQMKYAAKNGVNLLVCDNEVELCKISRCHPNAKYVLMGVLTLVLLWLESYSFYHWHVTCLSLNLRTCFSLFRLLLQVATEAICRDDDMAMTFGCSLKACRHLLERAKELGVQVVGVRWALGIDA